MTQMRNKAKIHAQSVADGLKRKRLILLVGAGISCMAPANLPLAGQLCNGLWQLIVDRLPPSLKAIQPVEEIGNRPEEFLALMFRGLGDHLFGYLDGMVLTAPNEYHYFIASLAKSGFLTEVWTTNFDNLIEKACQDIGYSHQVWCPSDDIHALKEEFSGLRILKLHGTLQDQNGNPAYESMQFSTYQVDRPFQEELQRYIQTSLNENDLLVLGYSGQDPYDIQPCLKQPIPLSDLIWILHTNSSHLTVITKDADNSEFIHIVNLLSHRIMGRAITINTVDFLGLVGEIIGIPFSRELPSKTGRPFWENAEVWANRLPQGYLLLTAGVVNWNNAIYDGKYWDPCRRVLQHTYNLAEKDSDFILLATTLLWMAMLEEHVEEIHKAEKYYQEALDISRSNRLRDLEIEIIYEYAVFLDKRERITEARELFKNGYEKNQLRDNPFWEAQFLSGLGMTASDSNTAVKYFQQVHQGNFPLGFTKKLNIIEWLVWEHRKLGNLPELVAFSMEYLHDKALIYGVESVYETTPLRIMGELATYSLDPRADADWKDIDQTLSVSGLKALWLDWLERMVPIVAEWYGNTQSELAPETHTYLALDFVENMADFFDYIDFTKSIAVVISFLAEQAPDTLEAWLTKERVDAGSESLWKGLAVAIIRMASAPDFLLEVFDWLAMSDDMPTLGAIAYTIEEVSLKDKKKAFFFVFLLIMTGNRRAKVFAASALEALAKEKDMDAWKILETLRSDPFPPIATAAARYMQYYDGENI